MGWLTTFRSETARTRLRLICVPYAGGSTAAYRQWTRWLPEEVALLAIEFPGHGTRFVERPMTSMSDLVREAQAEIVPLTYEAYALFGHSLGAVVAYELANHFRSQGVRLPERLFVSGQRAFHRPSPRPPIHHLPDVEFLDEIRRYGGTPNEVFEDPELRSIYLPMLRADFTLGETYRHESAEPLSCAISAYGGLSDSEVASDDVKAWRAYTNQDFNARMFPGGHFFLHQHAELVVTRVLQDLQPL